ncbi:MAG TPA: DNA primase [Thermodesulforhabdus norvegica]|uniref:DNA primase n=1 Tax=Thermodesulforhabdus norvegica TaxID=39841 RepID=A0A7C0WSF8_9BACT|nr:DNA primase [Thermodesulforhabdus norvegica]
MNHLDEIRAKLNIEDIVSGYVQLKKAGRNLKGLCPFHNDSRPSFMVSPEKGIGYCFSCNTGGDIFKFIQLIENVDFPAAVRILADKAGVRLPEFKPEVHNEKLRILKANEMTTEFFADQLKDSKSAMEYFVGRGLTEATIKEFKLGLSPDSYTALRDHMKKADFDEKLLLSAGLISQRSIADKNTYDRFRNRYMFPIHDQQGNAVGFGGRIIGDGEPKYLNSPDTPVYNKSFVLYGLSLAKDSIKKEDLAIFVEGYMDVIAAHQAGTRNTVATSGTALTAPQLKLIKRYTRNIAFAFDADSAGLEATKRAIELAREAELNIRIIQIPEGKDPDECIQKSPEAWKEAIKKAVKAMDFYFTHAFSLYNPGDLEGKKSILDLLLPLIKQTSTSMEQNEHLKRLAFELKTEVKYLWEDMKNLTAKKTYKPASKIEAVAQKKDVFSREEFLLGFILEYPDLYKIVHENLIDVASFDQASEKIYKALKKVYNSRSVIDAVELRAELSEREQERLDILPLLIEEHYPDFSQESAKKEVITLIRQINRKNVHSSQKEFEFKIRAAQDPGERTLLLNQYSQILKLANKI